MSSKDTILSQNDLALLESVVLRYGKIVTFEQIQAVTEDSATRGSGAPTRGPHEQSRLACAPQARLCIWW